MIRISDERALLPIVRNPLANWDETERQLLPLFLEFVASELTIDHYKGWAYSMKFIKNTNVEYQEAVASMDMSKRIEEKGWTFTPSLKNNDECIWVHNDTAILVHLESWLWFG